MGVPVALLVLAVLVIWFDGAVATSYPVQGKAQALVIVR
jgi:hypothetical protein